MKKLKELFTVLIGAGFGIFILVLPVLYLYALWIDIKRDNFGAFAADLLIPPIGVIHGLIIAIWP